MAGTFQSEINSVPFCVSVSNGVIHFDTKWDIFLGIINDI
jgi:hypothetical protein